MTTCLSKVMGVTRKNRITNEVISQREAQNCGKLYAKIASNIVCSNGENGH